MQTAMPNGRCYLHGGRTPKADDWHRPVWPKGHPRAVEKMNAKLRDIERARKKREARLADLSPEERQAHREWQMAHKPGKAVDRKRARGMRKANAAARATLGVDQSYPPSPELVRVTRAIEALEKLRAARSAAIEEFALGAFD
ncbi:hypothetical protein GCM10011390_44000 [Aureimonas endophytica]|uniref:Uncharacterized protein n=2 Tax=Aureimonas endophytica TaxID=2027858 RepID=A0A917EC18_9HYPH|nr:hypothetical protein GCM10011390_44000 [Aureimonas endophytica]